MSDDAPSDGAVAVPNRAPPPNEKVKTMIASLAVVVGLAGTAYSITHRASRTAEPDTTSPAASAATKAPETKTETKPETNPAESVHDAPTPSVAVSGAPSAKAAPTVPGAKPTVALSAAKPPAFKPGPWPPAPKPAAAPSKGQKPDALDIGY